MKPHFAFLKTSVLFLLTFASIIGSYAAAPPEAGLKPKAENVSEQATKKKETSTKIIPLPIYSTLPNEGSTFGFMPVFLVVESDSQRTLSIFAPSASYNKTIRATGTFRWYHYPSLTQTINLIASFSSNVNRNYTFEYFDEPTKKGKWTKEFTSRGRRSIFYRFFGIGPLTSDEDESSYTRLTLEGGTRIGYNLTRTVNIAVLAGAERQAVEKKAVPNLPLTNTRFPTAPGLRGATTAYQGISLRYDSRPLRQYSLNGWNHEIAATVNENIAGTKAFTKVRYETKGIWTESDSLLGAARLYWGYTSGGDEIPFYHQSSLGGSFRLRGFTEDRFIDNGAWTLELEQRYTMFQTEFYGVVTDWRLDPFIAIGQVYQGLGDMFRDTRVAGGVGFRAWVRPNVVGRVDMAIAGEGLKLYVELGYPF